VSTASLRWLLDDGAHAAPDVFAAGPDAPAAVLAAMTGEGLLVPALPGVWLAADAAASPAARCRALTRLAPARGVVAGGAALWARGLLATCPRVDVVLPPGAAGGSRSTPDGVRLRGLALGPGDVEALSGLALTTPARTAADVARWCPDGEQAAVAWVAAVLRAGCAAEQVRAALEVSPRSPGVRRGRRVLAAAAQS